MSIPVPDDRDEPLRILRATCAPGLTRWLTQEIRALGYEVESSDHTGVELRGRMVDAMRLCLRLRTAYHILQRFGDVHAKDPDALYEGASGLPWERVIPEDGYVSVVSSVPKDFPHNSMFINTRLKDAIVDRIKRLKGRRPDSGSQTDKAVVHLHLNDERCRISLDISGRKLSDRGYRKIPGKAPMRESIAAAILIEADYDGTRPLIVPMCGSGTIAIEAALMASGRAPGLLRTNFGVQHLKTFDEKVWSDERHAARKASSKSSPAPIIVSDNDPEMVEAARKNAVTAGVDHLLDFHVCDFADTPMPDSSEEPGTIILHGEYGERLGNPEQLEATYRRMGDFLKQECGGWDAYVFTSKELAGSIGLKTSARIPFEHGNMDCRLLRYQVYAGTKRQKISSGTAPETSGQ